MHAPRDEPEPENSPAPTRAEDNAMIAAKLISAPSVPIRHAAGGLVADGITPRPPSRHLIEQNHWSRVAVQESAFGRGGMSAQALLTEQ